MLRVITIGTYGFEQEEFFGALVHAHVDIFCDLRFRRGVRGPANAFANSKRLQNRLATLDIRYVHIKELAPARMLREQQWQADKRLSTTRRKRAVLEQNFIAGYKETCLSQLDARNFIVQLGLPADVIALFCVEGNPEACHRSLVAEKLAHDLDLEVVHLLPGTSMSASRDV
jgi:uncharacterized protein (DUF488 family)